jgi:hypothetical protein
MNNSFSLSSSIALHVNKIVTLFFDFLVPVTGPCARVFDGSNCQNNAKRNK